MTSKVKHCPWHFVSAQETKCHIQPVPALHEHRRSTPIRRTAPAFTEIVVVFLPARSSAPSSPSQGIPQILQGRDFTNADKKYVNYGVPSSTRRYVYIKQQQRPHTKKKRSVSHLRVTATRAAHGSVRCRRSRGRRRAKKRRASRHVRALSRTTERAVWVSARPRSLFRRRISRESPKTTPGSGHTR